jgi:hypothetical protein
MKAWAVLFRFAGAFLQKSGLHKNYKSHSEIMHPNAYKLQYYPTKATAI